MSRTEGSGGCSVTLALTTQVPHTLPSHTAAGDRDPPELLRTRCAATHSLDLTRCNSPLLGSISLPSVRPTTSQTSAIIASRKDCIVSSYYTWYPAVLRPFYSHALTFTSLSFNIFLAHQPPLHQFRWMQL